MSQSLSGSAYVKTDPKKESDLLDAITGRSITNSITLYPVNVSISRPVNRIHNNKIILGHGYNVYTIGGGTGLGYSKSLSQSSGAVFDFKSLTLRGRW